MDYTFKTWKRSREIITNILESYSEEQLIKIPKGFNNNLIWNIGHIIAVNQKLIYKSSNSPIIIPEALLNQYNTGTFPNLDKDRENIPKIKKLLAYTVEKSIYDYHHSNFNKFNELITGTGFHISSIEEAFSFNNYHEALHIGLMLNIKKFI